MVAANYLADAGHDVLVLEAQAHLGGAVSSDRGVHPDFVHDLASTFHPLAAASPILAALDLPDYGLVRTKAPAVLGHPHVRDGWFLQHEDVNETAAGLDTLSSGDGEVLVRMWEHWQAVGDEIVRSLVSPFPPTKATGRLLRSSRHRGFLGSLALPLDMLVRQFSGPAYPTLLAGNAAHSDMSNRLPGSGLMAIVLTMLGHQTGFVVPRGGAQGLTDALAARLRSRGGETRVSSEVTRIESRAGVTTGVVLASGERCAADAVVACVSAPALYQQLLDPSAVKPHIARAMTRFEWDPGTFRVDWALSGPIPWRHEPAAAPGTLHIADSRAQMTQNLTAIRAGRVPLRPFIVAGQMTTTDATRSPSGTEAVGAYTRIPQAFRSDDGAQLRGRWDSSDCERFADRLQQRLEEQAPGFSDRVLARRVLGPKELEQLNANLVNGAIGGGTQRLRNQVFFRPNLGGAGPATGVRGLFLGSASAHPGGGVHGGPGHSAALAVLAQFGRRST